MTARQPFAPGPASAPDPRRLVSRTKIATLVGSAVGFGAVAGLVLLGPGSATPTVAAGDAGAQGQGAARTAPQAPAQQPAATQAGDFFSPPPGFSAQPPLSSGFSGQGAGGSGGSAGAPGGSGAQGFGGQRGFGAQGFGTQGGLGGQAPGMRTGGS